MDNLYEDEALDLIEEIMDIIEEDDISELCLRDVVASLKNARDCLVREYVNEDVNLTEEYFKAGSIKLKDKSYVKISKSDARVLNATVSGTENKTKMIESATKSKKDFNEFLSFARSLDEDFSGAIDELLSEASIEDLEYIAENELSEGESWDIISNSTKLGTQIGKKVGSAAGAAGGAMYGAAGGSVIALTKALLKKRKGRNINRYFSEDENNQKKSILGTSAPAMDSDPNEDDEKKDLQEVNQRAFSRITGLKPIRPASAHQFADSVGGDSSNYKDPAKISYDKSRMKDMSNRGFNYDTEFYKTASKDEKIALEKKWGPRASYFKEDVEDLQEISAKALRNYTDEALRDQIAVDLTGSTDPKFGKNRKTFLSNAAKDKHFAKRERGIEAAERALARKKATNDLYKRMGLTKLIKEESDTAYYYLINKAGASVTAHTSQPFFRSYEEAKEYQKKYKHVSSIKSSEIVKGKSDRYGFIRVIAETDLHESGGLGGHPANYRNPAEKPIKFNSVEAPVKPNSTHIITNNRANIDGPLASKVGDIVNVKFSSVWFFRMRVIEMLPNNQIKVQAFAR